MCARRPMPKPFLCCERAFCCSMVVMWPVLMHVMSFDVVVMSFDAMWLLVWCHVTWCNAMSCDVALMWCALQWSRCVFEVVLWRCGDPKYYSVLQSISTTLYYKVLVLLCTTKYYSSTTLYCKVLLQYYSVLQSTTPVLLCTTKYYSSTTRYYTVLLQYYSSTTPVLLQYYSVLQSTTPVLLCTTKYYSSTTLYYTVLQSTTPVLLCTTKYYSSTCTAKYYSNTTLYYKVLLQYYSVLHSTTPVLLQYYSVLQSTTPVPVLQSTTPILLCTAKYYSSSTLYYKAAFMIDPWHIWTASYMARSNRSHPPTPPNTAPATQNYDCDDWSASHMKRHLQCAEQQESQSNFTKYCTCHAKWISWLIRVSHETSFTMRGGTGITIQLHQILRLPGKMNLMIDPHQIWNVIYNARSNQSHPPTAPNTAPATQTHSHDSSSSHMKRHLQCAEQHCFPFNTTKYCACHEILSSRCQRKIPELLPPIERRFEDNPTMIRAWSDHEIVISHSPLRRPYSSHLGDAFCMENTTFRAPAIYQIFTKCCACHEKWHSNFTKYCACHAKWISWLIRIRYETSFTMRGATRVTLQLHQILRLPRKLTLMIVAPHIWNVIYNARSNTGFHPTSPNTAPATKF